MKFPPLLPETVANLTLMALGSSAPEILLAALEVIRKDFSGGELGPSTILGSAAFNSFVVVAICVLVIPTDQVRRIKHLRVFIVTAVWSILAYLWILVILRWSSPGVIEIWEGAVTISFFFATVLSAYIADKCLLKIDKLKKSYRLNKRGVVVEAEANPEMGMGMLTEAPAVEEEEDPQVTQFDQERSEYLELLRQLRNRFPLVDLNILENLARAELLLRSHKSRAFYRVQATQKLTSGQDPMKKFQSTKTAAHEAYTRVAPLDKLYEHVTRISFTPDHYSVMENAGVVKLTVARTGGNPKETVTVDYTTENGTAKASEDYIQTSGTLTFGPDETTKEISIEIIDDDVFEEDEHFFVKLSSAKFDRDQKTDKFKGIVRLDLPFRATVTILDDDYGGNFNVAEVTEVEEGGGSVDVKVTRAGGARGKVTVPYTTVPGTAKPGKDYEHVDGILTFENNETE